jgi:hypothetical protein
MLTLTQRFDCQDDRDRIYGLIGLPTTDAERVANKIRPDYASEVGEVYTQLTELIIDASCDDHGAGGNLDILSSVQRAHNVNAWIKRYIRPRTEHFRWRLPSWVPQWQFLLTTSLSPFERDAAVDACGGRAMQRRKDDEMAESGETGPQKGYSLTVRGVLLDIVAATESCSFQDFYRSAIPNRSYWRLQPDYDGIITKTLGSCATTPQ